MKTTYNELNAALNLWGDNGEVQLDKDKEAARAFFLEEVNPNTVFFHSLEEKTSHLIAEGFWKEEPLHRYEWQQTKELFKYAYSKKFRFPTFMGAMKFYRQYALKNADGDRWYERYEDRVVLNALEYSQDYEHAKVIVDEIMSGRFQPATPTFLNAGRAAGGKPVSCFLLRIDDSMLNIGRAIHDSLQLSKNGGGVALLLTNLREQGAPIKGFKNQALGVIPVMKLLEDSFSYANQLGQRQGAGAVYLNAHHPDIMKFLDTKRENADEKIRIKTLSLGIVVPDITFELAKRNDDMYLFSPYDVERVMGKPMSDLSVTEHYYDWVEDERITKKKINARTLFQTIAEIQFESGYPYLMFEDNANKWNPVPNYGRINMSNLCSEIMQPNSPSVFNEDGTIAEPGKDISCNLGSLNIAKMMKLKSPEQVAQSVLSAVSFLTEVSVKSNVNMSPTVYKGNDMTRAIGLGQMNLHGFFIEQGIDYDSPKARAFFTMYMANMSMMSEIASRTLSKKYGAFDGYGGSLWAPGEDGLVPYDVMQAEALAKANERILSDHAEYGESVDETDKFIKSMPLYSKEIVVDYWLTQRKTEPMTNAHLQAIPPTGSISYINHSTSSIHPVVAAVETRKEGMTGRNYCPAYGLTQDNYNTVKTAYQYGPGPTIKMYAAAAPFVDQGISATLFFRDTATTRDINRAQIMAWQNGLKALYYIRLNQAALSGTEAAECVSCTL